MVIAKEKKEREKAQINHTSNEKGDTATHAVVDFFKSRKYHKWLFLLIDLKT